MIDLAGDLGASVTGAFPRPMFETASGGVSQEFPIDPPRSLSILHQRSQQARGQSQFERLNRV